MGQHPGTVGQHHKNLHFGAGFIGNMVGGSMSFGYGKLFGEVSTEAFAKTAYNILFNTTDGMDALFGNLMANKTEEALGKK